MNAFVQGPVHPSGGKKGPVGGASWQRPPARGHHGPGQGPVRSGACEHWPAHRSWSRPRRAVSIWRRGDSSHRGPGPLGGVPGWGGRCARPEGCGTAPGAPVRSVHARSGPERMRRPHLGPPRHLIATRVMGRSRRSTPRRGKPLTSPRSGLPIPQGGSCRPPRPTEGAYPLVQVTTLIPRERSAWRPGHKAAS